MLRIHLHTSHTFSMLHASSACFTHIQHASHPTACHSKCIITGKEEPVPEHPYPGQQWKEVRHDKTVTWLAYWKEPIAQKDFKYVWLAANSTFKSDSDLAKYEKARKLKVTHFPVPPPPPNHPSQSVPLLCSSAIVPVSAIVPANAIVPVNATAS